MRAIPITHVSMNTRDGIRFLDAESRDTSSMGSPKFYASIVTVIFISQAISIMVIGGIIITVTINGNDILLRYLRRKSTL